MATFQVPQFIEEKPKIAGPLTLHQVLIVAGATLASVAAFYTLNLFLWVIVTIILGVGAIGFAFVKVEGRPMTRVVRNGFSFLWRPRVYVWRREMPEMTIDTGSLERLLGERRRAGMQERLKTITNFVATKKSRSGAHIAGEQRREKERLEAVHYITGETEVAKRVDYK